MTDETQYRVNAKYVDMDAAVVRTGEYPNGTMAVVLVDRGAGEQEVISKNLQAYDLVPGASEFYVTNYAEHEGLAEALERADIAIPVGTALFGPYQTTATLMRLLVEARPL